MGKPKPTPRPAWWKNTFFWFAGVLFVLAVVGLISGEATIRDPGQVRESGLVWIYLGGAALMLINGALTHGQALRAFAEAQEDK
ncbi:MAG: hypothetical protein WD716_04730 [Fimbriimonadaceae bacterium]